MQACESKYDLRKTAELKCILEDCFDTSIFYPIVLGDEPWDKIKELICAGADPNVKASGEFYQDYSLLEALAADEKNYSYHQELFTFLLKKGANPNSCVGSYDSTLSIACRSGCARAVAELIKYGAHVNYKNSLGQTPLYQAVDVSSVSVVQFLLANGAAPDIETSCDVGQTPLSIAQDNDWGIIERTKTKTLLESYRKQKIA